jgi:tRNA-2-methylthio-N6-dimethylallyladenosine synthase
MSKKVFIKTFGCQMNEYDSDKMADVLNLSEGLVKTDTPDDADVILFNTCSVRSAKKGFSDLGRIKHLKAKGVQMAWALRGQRRRRVVASLSVVFGPKPPACPSC